MSELSQSQMRWERSNPAPKFRITLPDELLDAPVEVAHQGSGLLYQIHPTVLNWLREYDYEQVEYNVIEFTNEEDLVEFKLRFL